MNQIINKIYPQSKKAVYQAKNLFLEPVLSRLNGQKPTYFANFLMSFDGRIAIFSKKYRKLLTPRSIKSDIDFSLFCQLQAQADCLVTNTSYINGLSKGYYGNILSTKDEALKNWRIKNNIKRQDIILLSNSLNFPINKHLELYKDRMIILSTAQNTKKYNQLKEKNFNIIKCSGNNVSANKLNNLVIKNKYKAVYFIAGPRIVEQMISKNLIDRYYCSICLSMLGTEKYDTIIRGNFLKKAINLELIEMYIHTQMKNKTKEQMLFQIYNLKG